MPPVRLTITQKTAQIMINSDTIVAKSVSLYIFDENVN